MAYQKFPNSKQLAAEIKSGKLENMYLFLGEEEGEKEKIISRITDIAITGPDEKEYSARRFHLESGDFKDAAEFALSASMFSDNKVCVMLNINSLKAKSEDRQLLKEVISSKPDETILIMTSPENKIPAVIDSKDLKFIKAYQFWRLFENDILGYITASFRKNGLEMERSAAIHLIDLTGRDIHKIDESLGMIIDSGEKHITKEIINKYIQNSKEFSVFEFIESLFKKEKSSYYKLARVLDNGTHELAILKLIMRQTELIEKYYDLIKNNLNSEAAMNEIGINPRNQANFNESLKAFSQKSIKTIFPLIYKTDKQIKSYSYSNNVISNPIFELVTEIILQPAE
ncbi:MAG: DNA polymerase III subunit delta [Spirochaetota bacterium]